MICYLYDANAMWVFQLTPKGHEFTKRAKSAPPMLEIFIVLNEKDKKKYQGEGNANNSKVKEGGGRGETHFFFMCVFKKILKRIKRLGCLPRSACLRSVAWPVPPISERWCLGMCTGEGVEWCSGVQNFPSVSRRNPKTGRDRGRSIRSSISIEDLETGRNRRRNCRYWCWRGCKGGRCWSR